MTFIPVPKRLLEDAQAAINTLAGYVSAGSPPEWDGVVYAALEGLGRALQIGVEDVSEVGVPPRVSEVCRTTHVQNCHVCEDLGCADNTSLTKKLQEELQKANRALWSMGRDSLAQAAEVQSLRGYVAKVEDENAALLAELGPYRGGCHACNVEGALGTEECPHPVDPRVHTCGRENQRKLPCGCVACVCEDPVQCHGCGAKLCPEHARRGP